MSLVLDTGTMKYRENPNQPWRPLVIKANMNWESMADTYDPDNGTYEIGRYVLEDGVMYRCIYAIDTPETWTPAHWTEINIGDELFSLQDSIVSEATTRASEDTLIRNTFINTNISKLIEKYRIHNGYINVSDGQWKSLTSTSYYHAIIPVSASQTISVLSNGSGSSGIAALKSYAPVLDQQADFSSDTNWNALITVGTSTTQRRFVGVLPNDVQYLYVYLGGSAYNRAPSELIIDGYNYMESAVYNIMKQSSKYTKIRIMQNNVGHFNMGQSVTGEAQYLTEENFSEKINAYKNLYGIIQPDIIGLEEFNDTRDVYENGTVSRTVNINELIYDLLYPYNYLYNGLSSAPCLKSKYFITSISRENYEYTYIYNGETSTGNQRAIYAHIDVDGKNVGVIVAAMPSGAGSEAMAKRKGAITAAIDLMVNDEYAFIVCDENNAGEQSSTTIEYSVLEGNAIYNDVLVPKGFNSAMGSYFQWTQSYKSTNTAYISSVDNILYKDNGRILLSGMTVLASEYTNLLSDHFPLYADFILL